MSKTGNTTAREVDQYAGYLAREFNNTGYRKWYCMLIYELGINRVKELEGRVSDARDPGKLFSCLAGQELNAKKVQDRLGDVRRKYFN